MDYEKLGLTIIKDFITLEKETEILKSIDKKEKARQTRDRNSIQRFGSKAPYNSFVLSNVIPPFLDAICQRLVDEKLVLTKPDSVSINQYLEGQIITAHIDSKASGPVISILSLLSEATMDFESKKLKQAFSVDIPPRSLLQMRNDIRTLWTHAIKPVKQERYSIVFRCSDK